MPLSFKKLSINVDNTKGNKYNITGKEKLIVKDMNYMKTNLHCNEIKASIEQNEINITDP
jgi:hypothetical protein